MMQPASVYNSRQTIELISFPDERLLQMRDYLFLLVKRYILEYVATETPEQMQKSQGMITGKEEKEFREIWRISIEDDKARKDFAVNSVSRISTPPLPAVKSK